MTQCVINKDVVLGQQLALLFSKLPTQPVHLYTPISCLDHHTPFPWKCTTAAKHHKTSQAVVWWVLYQSICQNNKGVVQAALTTLEHPSTGQHVFGQAAMLARYMRDAVVNLYAVLVSPAHKLPSLCFASMLI